MAIIPEEQLAASTVTDLGESIPETTTATTLAPFTYRIGVLAAVSTDNFWAFYGEQPSVWNSYVLGPTKPALLTVDPETSELTPELAEESSEASDEDGVWSVELALRRSLAWSDGEPITAEDFVFTFRAVRDLKLGGSWSASYPEALTSVEAISDYRLRLEFTDNPAYAVWPHAVGTAPVMPEHVWADLVTAGSTEKLYAASGESDVGGGPLALVSVGDTVMTSMANPGYTLSDSPDQVEYVVFADENAMVTALQEGRIDAVATPKGLASESLDRLDGQEVVAVETNPANGVRYLGFNLDREPMADKAFRQAVALLVDRAGLADRLGGGGHAAFSFVRPANELWYDESAAEDIADMYSGDLSERLTRAVVGLREAGYSWESEPSVSEGSVAPGSGLTIGGAAPAVLTILTPGDAYDPARPDYVGEIAETIELLGFDVRPVVTDFDTVVDLAFGAPDEGARQYDMYLLGWTLGSPSLPDYYRPLFASSGAMNNTGYSNADFDEQLEQYENSKTLDQAKERLWYLERTLAEDIPYLLLYTTEITEAYRSDRITYTLSGTIGGIQGRLGGVGDVEPAQGISG